MPCIGLQQSFRGGLWGGDGFILQKLEGQGRAWIELSGELVHYTLSPGQTLMVHPGHVGMFEGSVEFSITRLPGIANVAFGADGFHLVALTGRVIWLPSMPLPILAHGLEPYLARQAAPQAAESGAIGDIACADSNQERLFFSAERSVVSASPHAPCAQWYQPPQSFPQISYRLLSVEHYLGDS